MLIEEFKKDFPNVIIKENEPLSLYTYTKTGGPADILVFPKTTEEVNDVVQWVKNEKLPLTVLGNASNLIVKDGGIRGVIMILTEMKQIKIEKKKITYRRCRIVLTQLLCRRRFMLAGPSGM